MKKKVLFVAHVDSHIQAFHIPYLKMFHDLDYEVHVASCGDRIFDFCDKKFNIPFQRNPFKVDNFKAYIQLKTILNENHYDIIHCHTPVGGFIARIANRFSHNYQKTLMIYTAHGFHFFNGSSKLNWLLFYPIERLAAHFTDKLITINKEDFNRAKKFKLKEGGHLYYVPGVGIDIEKIQNAPSLREALLQKFKLNSNIKFLLSVGELNDNKNHATVIRCLPYLDNSIHYFICGLGNDKKLITLADKLNVQDRVHLLGYRNDIYSIMKSCDIFVFPSKREGLSVAMMEAMASGLPIVASDIRGNRDLIRNGYNGYLFDVKHPTQLPYLLSEAIHSSTFKEKNLYESQKYDINMIKKTMKEIYELKGDYHD